jgi:hypothetical protein
VLVSLGEPEAENALLLKNILKNGRILFTITENAKRFTAPFLPEEMELTGVKT